MRYASAMVWERIVLATVALAVLASPGAAQDAVGINAHVPSAAELSIAAESGVTWVRMDANWWQLEPAAGSYAWGPLDAAVDAARAEGLNVYLTLAYTPDWVPVVDRPRDDDYSGNDEPVTATEWVRFVDAAVRHYRARGVTHFGLWNEANLDHFWDGSLQSYVETIALPGADAVRSACADCVTVGPDLAHINDADDALDEVLRRGMSAFDIVSHHLYNDFEETDWNGFSGDSFLHALESGRSDFTRDGLREVLDRRGWTGEVWISETGYRATPDDSADEATQATYVRRVLEEQLERTWWTKSFFYELIDCGIDLPDCSIDGYGILRPTRTLPRGPGDYRRKAAFDALSAFTSERLPGTEGPIPCANGVDDDGDGKIDDADRGCDSGDGDEDDEALRVEAVAATITVDGDLGDWSDARWVPISVYSAEPAPGDEDLSARAAFAWADGSLFLAVEVTDDTLETDTDTLWMGDSVQLAFDLGGQASESYDDDDHELTLAPLGAGIARRDAGEGTAPQLATDRSGSTTTYEARFSAAALPGFEARAGAAIGMTLVVNENDGGGREGWLRLTRGLAEAKSPYFFAELHLLAEDAPPPDGGSAPGPDGGTGGESDEGGGCAAATGSGGGALFVLLALAWRRRRA